MHSCRLALFLRVDSLVSNWVFEHTYSSESKAIDLIHNPTMHLFRIPQCTIQIWCIVGYGTSSLWDLWVWSIPKRVEHNRLNGVHICWGILWLAGRCWPWQYSLIYTIWVLVISFHIRCTSKSDSMAPDVHRSSLNPRVPVFINFAWTNSWENNRDAGDLRRHCAHYDVTIMDERACKCVEEILHHLLQ